MEHGLGATNHVSSAIHTPSSSGNTVNTDSQTLPDVANNFHVYSVNWSPNQITFMIDGVGYYTYNPVVKNSSTWPFDLEQYLLLNVAMGGVAGTIDPTFMQSDMVIDYVKVYQNVLSTEEFDRTNFRIYPNPASDQITIDTNVAVDTIEIYNTIGKLVERKETVKNNIDISSLDSGLYILRLYSGENSVVKKLIIK